MRMIPADELEQELNRIYDKYLHPNDNHPLGTPYGGRVVGDITRHFKKWVKKNGVDAVPVVRCYECENSIAVEQGYIWCKLREPHPRDWFCADGKPKKEGNK